MKIRTDFVTNSSSSSFVVFGVDIKALELDVDTDSEEFDEEYSGSMTEYVNAILDEKDSLLTVGNADYDSDEIWIGLTPQTLFDKFGDRKIREIKQIVAEEIEKAFTTVKIDPKTVEYIEESSSNY